MKTVELFEIDGCQAFYLPDEYRFDCEELIVEKVGVCLLFYPKEDSSCDESIK